MIQVEDLHEVTLNETHKDNRFYQFNINRSLSQDELKIVESAIEKVLDNKELEAEWY